LAIGLQFHVETTPASADALIERCRHELVPGPYVQPETVIRSTPPHAYAAMNALMGDVLDYLVGAG
jgi:hypothetical protein